MSLGHALPEEDAPGRIPESLIDSVIDGSADDHTRRAVARALRHDPRQRRDVSETLEAIGGLREPVGCPDFSGGVLGALDRRGGFVPARVRRVVRRTRAGVIALALLALVGVSIAQWRLPRLAAIQPRATPVTTMAQAVRIEASEAAGNLRTGVRQGVRVMQASLPSLSDGMVVPGRLVETDLEVGSISHTRGRFRLVPVDGGCYFMLATLPDGRACPSAGRGGLVSSITAARWEGVPDDDATVDTIANDLLP